MPRRSDQLRLLPDLPAAEPRNPLAGLSVSGLVAYARCPRQCYWSVIEPRPRPASAAARVGSLIHGWIERRAAGQGSLLPVENPTSDSPSPDPLARLQAAFLASPYGGLQPLAVERPFAVSVGEAVVRGRVDALYDREGRLEVVDFKTGNRPCADDRAAGLQLDLYALAAVDAWDRAPEDVRTTEWYLAAGEGHSRTFDSCEIARVRRRVAEALEGLAAGRFAPEPGSYCNRCAFLGLCRTGQAALDASH
jgi:DNA helicase-2/ATP-dependent DNA helicase PcrA